MIIGETDVVFGDLDVYDGRFLYWFYSVFIVTNESCGRDFKNLLTNYHLYNLNRIKSRDDNRRIYSIDISIRRCLCDYGV